MHNVPLTGPALFAGSVCRWWLCFYYFKKLFMFCLIFIFFEKNWLNIPIDNFTLNSSEKKV